jgi:hypothetical protein
VGGILSITVNWQLPYPEDPALHGDAVIVAIMGGKIMVYDDPKFDIERTPPLLGRLGIIGKPLGYHTKWLTNQRGGK